MRLFSLQKGSDLLRLGITDCPLLMLASHQGFLALVPGVLSLPGRELALLQPLVQFLHLLLELEPPFFRLLAGLLG